jgi:hypothetical protein
VRDQELKLEEVKVSQTLGGEGNGIPQDREVDKRQGVCEWEGCVCVCEVNGGITHFC